MWQGEREGVSMCGTVFRTPRASSGLPQDHGQPRARLGPLLVRRNQGGTLGDVGQSRGGAVELQGARPQTRPRSFPGRPLRPNPMRRRRKSHIHHTYYNLTPTPNPKPYPLTPALVDEWVRVLVEEGIEPNPGPTFITKNINGISDIRYWERVLIEIKKEHLNIPIKAIFFQEHHLKKAAPARAMAEEHGFYLMAVPLHSQIHRGGTAILIPHDQLEKLNPNESQHAALARVKATMRALPNGRGIACDTLVEGKMRRLASIYAPSAPNERIAFFSTLRNIINSNTIMGIDANCVPDVTLDRSSSAPSPYDNTGANTLNDTIAHLGLIDVARESLGNEPFFTCFHGQSKTRIDRIYAPDEDGIEMRVVGLGWVEFKTIWSSGKDEVVGTVSDLVGQLKDIMEKEEDREIPEAAVAPILQRKTFRELGTPTMQAEELADQRSSLSLEGLLKRAEAERERLELCGELDRASDLMPAKPPPLDASLVGKELEIRWRYWAEAEGFTKSGTKKKKQVRARPHSS